MFLFIDIGLMKVFNRFVVLLMCNNYVNIDGILLDIFFVYYKEWVFGGFGFIIFEVMVVDVCVKGGVNKVCLYSDY